MKKIRQITKILFCVMFFSSLFISCEDEMDKHYEIPEGLNGSVWEVLNEKKDYTIFLEGAELAGFKPLLEGRAVLTVMAPNDASMTAYLQEKGFSNVSQMETSELRKLIGFHLIYYSYNKSKLLNFCPQGDLATDENKQQSAGRYYKFRTWSSDAPSVALNPETGREVTVYHLDRFIPVFTNAFFERKNIDPKSSYEYFYPNSTWTGGTDGFNVSNASVTDYAIQVNNGYVYTVDRVLEPLETIYNEIKNSPEYSTFLELYDSYTSYDFDEVLTSDYGSNIGVDSLYLHRHSTLPSIAMEWPTSSFQYMTTLMSGGFTLFAPSNNALDGFFNNYWKAGGYESLKDIDASVMNTFMLQFVSGSSIAFPEQIAQGLITNAFGVALDFDPYTIKDKAICVNGSFYGMETMQTPPLFESVAAPALKSKDNLAFFYALDGSSLLTSYASEDASYILLIPNNDQMTASGYELKTYDTGTFLQIDSEDGWVNVGSSTMQNITNMHTVLGVSELATTGAHVYATQNSFNYWFVKDGKITSNTLFNQLLSPDYTGDPFVEFAEITNDGGAWINGKAYTYNNPDIYAISNPNGDGLQRALAASNDNRFPYNSFVQLMKKAEMVSGTSIPFLLETTRFITFIPTNEAIVAAIANNEIPGITNGTMDANGNLSVDPANLNLPLLRSYLSSYFLRTTENTNITTYPYLGSKMRNAQYNTPTGLKMAYNDNGETLTVQINGGSTAQVISKYNYFPFAYYDGCFHLIDKALTWN